MSFPNPTFTPRSAAREKFRPMTQRPLLLEVAFWTIVVAMGALAVVSVVFAIVVPSEYSIPVQVVSVAAIVGPTVVFAVIARGGVAWARVLLCVWLGWFLVEIVVSLFAQPSQDLWIMGFSILAAILAGVLAVLFWLPTPRAYFRAVADEKRRFTQRQLIAP